jgi:hypothetical protein
MMIFLYVLAHNFTLYHVAKHIEMSGTFSTCVESILNSVYAIIMVVLVCWLIFPAQSQYILMFGLATLITIIRIDLVDLEEKYVEARKQILNHN